MYYNVFSSGAKWLGPKIAKTGKKYLLKEGLKKTDKNVEKLIEEDGSSTFIEPLNVGEDERLRRLEKLSPKEAKEYSQKIREEQLRRIEEEERISKLPPELNIPEAPQSEDAIIMEDLITGGNSTESKKQEFFNEINNHNNQKEDIIYKNIEDITQQEVDDATIFGNYETKDGVLKGEINDKVGSWYDNVFGGDAVQTDETGKAMEIMPRNEPKTQPTELNTPDGFSIVDGFKNIASSAANFGVGALQTALNSMPSNRPQLQTDGIVGPKTVSRAKEALMRQGVGETMKNIGNTSFSLTMEQNKGKPMATKNLHGIVQKIDPQNGATALQRGINTVGQAIGGYKKIKEDGYIGPKTTEAFNQIKEGNEKELQEAIDFSYAPEEPKKRNYNEDEMTRYFTSQIR